MESARQECHILGMETRLKTYIVEAVLREAGRPDHVEKYYVTVQDGENPLDAFDREDTAPDTVSARIVGTLSDKQAAGLAFRRGSECA